jgi:hypothetical protein
MVILSSCGVDFYSGKRPSDFPNTRWVSIDPDMFFEVNMKYAELTGSKTYGEINIDGVITEIAVSFDYGTGVGFRDISYYEGKGINSYAWLFWGRGKFSKDKLVVTITDNSRGFLDDSITEIIFIREDMDD